VSDALARRIATHFRRRFCVLTGHGTTAIYLALRALGGDGEVIVPATGCPTIAQPVKYAGFTPRYADVRLDDFTIDIESARKAITSRTRAIVGVHLYGHSYDVNAVRALGLPVIEDAAQSLGGHIGDRLHGTFGDFAILSFSGTKIVDAGGGGALLLDDAAAYERVRAEAEAMPPFAETPLTTLSHWQLYHGAMNFLRVHPEARVDFVWRDAAALFRELYMHRFPEEKAGIIERGLDSLPEILAKRLARAERYHANLEGALVQRSDAWRRSGAIWRYNLLLRSREETNRVSHDLRANGVAVSNHDWSLADLFTGDKSLANSQTLSERIINLWVDDSATADKIDRACDLLYKMVR
jgi:dTDP-4-amino-4,6-dideoxygalactose transaminase